MSHIIKYTGDSTLAVDALLDLLFREFLPGDWYLRITTHDGETLAGWAWGFHSGLSTTSRLDFRLPAAGPALLALALSDDPDDDPDIIVSHPVGLDGVMLLPAATVVTIDTELIAEVEL